MSIEGSDDGAPDLRAWGRIVRGFLPTGSSRVHGDPRRALPPRGGPGILSARSGDPHAPAPAPLRPRRRRGASDPPATPPVP